MQKKAEFNEHEQREDDRRERWSEERQRRIEQELKGWDKTPVEERFKGQFKAWLMVHYVDPNSEEAQAKKKELIDELQTEEARRKYLERNIPIMPPTDFI